MTEAQGWTAERDALLAEVRALQAIIDHDRRANENCQKAMAALLAEVERLRNHLSTQHPPIVRVDVWQGEPGEGEAQWR